VFVPNTLADAAAAIDQIMVKKVFGDAGREVVVVERLCGPEVYVLAVAVSLDDDSRRAAGPDRGDAGAAHHARAGTLGRVEARALRRRMIEGKPVTALQRGRLERPLGHLHAADEQAPRPQLVGDRRPDGIEEAERIEGVTVYHSGTARSATGDTITAGGRVLGVTAVGDDLAQARDRAYEACARINFAGMHYRRDIGAAPVVTRQRSASPRAARTASTSPGAA
jgi:hypothetical protein